MKAFAKSALAVVGVSLAATLASAARQGLVGSAGGYLVALALFSAFVPVVVVSIFKHRVVFAAMLAASGFFAYGVAGRYAVFPAHSKEAGTRGNLGSVQSAVNLYAGDHNEYPSDPRQVVPKYIDAFPKVYTLAHGTVSGITSVGGADYAAGKVPDTGGWGYATSGPDQGAVFVDCIHATVRGQPWLSVGREGR